MLQPGYNLGGKWTITGLIGEGACAQVFSVARANNSNVQYPLVAKCIYYGKGTTNESKKEQERLSLTLNRERSLLAPGQLLTQFKYRPRIPTHDYYGKDETVGVVFLVMERLDYDLTHWARHNPQPPISLIATFGLQILDGLRWLHRKGWLFIDIKPDNFMLRGGNEIVFIDCELRQYYVIDTPLFLLYDRFNTL